MTTEKESFEFKRVSLENGTEIFYQRKEKGRTEIRLLLKAGGARYDPLGKEGCGHMLEHIICKKTSFFRDELNWRDYKLRHDLEWNASTDWESIWFEGNSDPCEIDHLFFLLGEFLTKSQLEEELLENEKKVVAREMGIIQKHRNWSKIQLELNRILFGGHHPFNRIIAPSGTLWSMSSLSIKDLERHREKFFVAPNLTVVIITSLSLKEVKARVKEYFALPKARGIEYPKRLKDFPKPEKNFYSCSLREILNLSEKFEEQGDVTECFAVVPSLKAISGWDIIALTLEEILERKLRYQFSMVYSASVSGKKMRDISLLAIQINSPSGKGLKVKDLIYEEIDGFKEKKELFKLFKKRRIRELKNYEATPSKVATEAVEDIALYDRPYTLREVKEELEKFNFEEAIEWVNSWFSKERILVRIINP